MRGGKVVALGLLLLPSSHRIGSLIAPEIVAAADELLDRYNDSKTEREVDWAGHASGDGKPWTGGMCYGSATVANEQARPTPPASSLWPRLYGRQGTAHQLSLALKTVLGHVEEGRLVQKIIYSTGRNFTTCEQVRWA